MGGKKHLTDRPMRGGFRPRRRRQRRPSASATSSRGRRTGRGRRSQRPRRVRRPGRCEGAAACWRQPGRCRRRRLGRGRRWPCGGHRWRRRCRRRRTGACRRSRCSAWRRGRRPERGVLVSTRSAGESWSTFYTLFSVLRPCWSAGLLVLNTLGGCSGGVGMCKSYYQIEPLGMAGRVSETSKH